MQGGAQNTEHCMWLCVCVQCAVSCIWQCVVCGNVQEGTQGTVCGSVSV